MNAKALQKALIKWLKGDIEYVAEQGLEGLQQTFLPTLEQAMTTPSADSALLAACWDLVAETFYHCDAPQKAIEGYQKSITYSDDESTYGVMAELYQSYGAYLKAFEAINKAIELAENPDVFMELRQSIQDYMNYDHTPTYTEGDNLWQLREQLANGASDKIIEQYDFSTTDDLLLLLHLNRVYGALNQVDIYQTIWDKIHQIDPEIEIYFADVFYMPLALKDQLEY